MRSKTWIASVLLLLLAGCGSEGGPDSAPEPDPFDLVRATRLAAEAVEAKNPTPVAFYPMHAKRYHLKGREVWWFDFKPESEAKDLSPGRIRMAGGNYYVTVDILSGDVVVSSHS